MSMSSVPEPHLQTPLETSGAGASSSPRAAADAQVLIDADALVAELAAGTPLTVIDVRYYLPHPGRGREEYLAGHIPGAVFVDVDTELARHSDGPGGRHPLPTPDDFGAAMRRAGVRASVPVVVYDQKTSLAAGRLWWMLTDAGHPDVRVLDGGFRAWRDAGGVLRAGEELASTPGDFRPEPGGRPLVDADRVAALLDEGHDLFDVRAPERYRGEQESIDPVAGHVPGAHNLPAAELFAPDGRFKDAAELRALLAHVRPGDAVSCGSGITAAQVLVALEVAGVRDVALYAGSWSDWISDPARPVASGPTARGEVHQR